MWLLASLSETLETICAASTMPIEQHGAEQATVVSESVLGRLISQTDHAKVELFDTDGAA